MRARANAVDRPSTRFNPNEVVSKVIQLLLNSRLSCSADGHHTNYSRDPDRDSENCQDTPHLVSEQCH
jgi:hypothetical protein